MWVQIWGPGTRPGERVDQWARGSLSNPGADLEAGCGADLNATVPGFILDFGSGSV